MESELLTRRSGPDSCTICCQCGSCWLCCLHDVEGQKQKVPWEQMLALPSLEGVCQWRLCWGDRAEQWRRQDHLRSHLRVVTRVWCSGHPAIASHSPGVSPARVTAAVIPAQPLLGPWPLWPLRGTAGPCMAPSARGGAREGCTPGIAATPPAPRLPLAPRHHLCRAVPCQELARAGYSPPQLTGSAGA